MEHMILKVGQTTGDLVGNTHLVLQAAVDYLSNIGGGTVVLGEGTYHMGSALHLRSNVGVVGTPGKTILRKDAMVSSKVTFDADLHQDQVTLAEPDKFFPGQTVLIHEPENNQNFFETVAVITGKKEDICYLDRTIYNTCLVERGAVVETNFPVISGYECSNVQVKDIIIDGNKAENGPINGCRGGGIFLMDASDVLIENCTIHDYNGDGISYQHCKNINVINCECRDNNAKGFHPGSGTENTLISGCKALRNGNDGIFLCWRVKNCTVENCISEGNTMSGLSIGHKDTHNVIRNCTFAENAYYGMFFRNDPENMSPDYNLVENNLIKDNGLPELADDFGYCAVRIRGNTNHVKFIGNKIVFEKRPQNKTIAFCCEQNTHDNTFEGNEIIGCYKEFSPTCVLNEEDGYAL